MSDGKKKRGRPSYSLVRERLKEILSYKGRMTAYEAHKHYIHIFSGCTRRNIYYQLGSGVAKNELSSEEVEEQGDFSWGTKTRKVYYDIYPDEKQKVKISKDVRVYFDALGDE